LQSARSYKQKKKEKKFLEYQRPRNKYFKKARRPKPYVALINKKKKERRSSLLNPHSPLKVKEQDSLKIANFLIHGKKLKYSRVSLCCFNDKSVIRKACLHIVHSPYFEHFITICILINAINIAWFPTVKPG
jgi:hypothetical protein